MLRVILFVTISTTSTRVAQPRPADAAALCRSCSEFAGAGETNRADFLSRFGLPSVVFQEECEFTQHASLERHRRHAVAHGFRKPQRRQPRLGGYQLLIAFDTSRVVERCGLIKPGSYHDPTPSILGGQAPNRPRYSFDVV